MNGSCGRCGHPWFDHGRVAGKGRGQCFHRHGSGTGTGATYCACFVLPPLERLPRGRRHEPRSHSPRAAGWRYGPGEGDLVAETIAAFRRRKGTIVTEEWT